MRDAIRHAQERNKCSILVFGVSSNAKNLFYNNFFYFLQWRVMKTQADWHTNSFLMYNRTKRAIGNNKLITNKIDDVVWRPASFFAYRPFLSTD